MWPERSASLSRRSGRRLRLSGGGSSYAGGSGFRLFNATETKNPRLGGYSQPRAVKRACKPLGCLQSVRSESQSMAPKLKSSSARLRTKLRELNVGVDSKTLPA